MTPQRKPASTPVETEAKIRVSSLAPVKRRIVAAGGRLQRVRTLESNTLFDSREGTLQAAGRSFRVRRYGSGGSVTLKGAPCVEGGLKSRSELETRVTAPEILAGILVSLGFVPQFRYEKFREVWKLGRTVICLDDTPLGPFVEIEGQPAAIHRAAAHLGLRAGRFMSESYPALWFGAGRSGDMVFPKRSRPGPPRRTSP